MEPSPNPVSDQYDSPWKEALSLYLRPMLEFCFPQVASAIDWTIAPKFLDQELQEITRDALGTQRVDKLIQVQQRNGVPEWILLHVEVQHRRDHNLAQRIYQYHHRVRDRFGQRVVSLVILADPDPDWRPDRFEEEVLGCRVHFEYPICKLLDLVERAQEASKRGQPSAVIIVANWATQRTRRNPKERRQWKWELTRRLYEAGLGRKEILELYRILDWLLRLPEGLEREYKEELTKFERSRRMPYITSIERIGRQEGREQGRKEGQQEGRQQGRQEGQVDLVLRLLRRRCGSLSPAIEQKVRALGSRRVTGLAEALLDFTGPADLDRWLENR